MKVIIICAVLCLAVVCLADKKPEEVKPTLLTLQNTFDELKPENSAEKPKENEGTHGVRPKRQYPGGYGYGYPSYGYGYSGYGYPGYGYSGYSYPSYGYSYPSYGYGYSGYGYPSYGYSGYPYSYGYGYPYY